SIVASSRDCSLRNDSKSKVIPISAFVVGLESVAPDSHCPAIGHLLKFAIDWRCGCVAEHCENRTYRYHAVAKIAEVNLRLSDNCQTITDDVIRRHSIAVNLPLEFAVGVEGQFALNQEPSG